MFLALLLFLLAGHALMDFALQSETMATCKCRKCDNPIAKAVPWYYWLTAHSTLHGAAVGAVIRWFGYDWQVVAAFGLAETAFHWVIDHGKCQRWYGIHIDQGLHVACKLLWWGLLAAGVVVSS
jgi:hypothetical protein